MLLPLPLYTDNFIANNPSIKLLKFADNTTVVGLIFDNNESIYRSKVACMSLWCSANILDLNTLKKVDMRIDFCKMQLAHSLLEINGTAVKMVELF